MSKLDKWNLKYWDTGEWQVIEERLKDVKNLSPRRNLLFSVLSDADPNSVRVAIIGQDPYPNPKYATGVAFSIPKEETEFPPTLKNIFQEYCDDLGYLYPSHGDLSRWVAQGVLLWNAYPSVAAGKPGSHHWSEWEYLTEELVRKLDAQDCVFILLGNVARKFSSSCKPEHTIETSHPSALGAKWGFLGSRIFSRTNQILRRLGKDRIDWELDHETLQGSRHKLGVMREERPLSF